MPKIMGDRDNFNGIKPTLLFNVGGTSNKKTIKKYSIFIA